MQCKKCGSNNIKTRFVKDGEVINTSSTERVKTEFLYSKEYTYFFTVLAWKDHLFVSCKNCGYSYRRNTLDAEPEGSNSDER